MDGQLGPHTSGLCVNEESSSRNYIVPRKEGLIADVDGVIEIHATNFDGQSDWSLDGDVVAT